MNIRRKYVTSLLSSKLKNAITNRRINRLNVKPKPKMPFTSGIHNLRAKNSTKRKSVRSVFHFQKPLSTKKVTAF